MMITRNPFRIRASEKLLEDATFLQFFSSGVLEIFEGHAIWDHIQIIASAPGGGKTSLLRLFEPSALRTLYSYQNDHRELFSKLKSIGAISKEKGPEVLGVLITLTRNYGDLEDLYINPIHKKRLFYSLLNSKIIISSLRNALTLKGLTYPNDLEKLQILRPSQNIPTSIPVPCSGKELHEWASGIESRISKIMDSFSSSSAKVLTLGQDTLEPLYLLNPKCIVIDGIPIADKVLLMLDDVHKLAPNQIEYLEEAVSVLRLPLGIWMSERLEAFRPEELLETAAKKNRESDEKIVLEEHWRDSRHLVQFLRILTDIAKRRLDSDPTVQISSIRGCLDVSSLDIDEWREKFSKIVEVIKNRIKEKNSIQSKYDDWIRVCEEESKNDTMREAAIRWRRLEIIIDRDINRKQTTLIPEDQYSPDLLKSKDSSSVKNAAEFFISKEFEIPYYYGFSNLVYLSSSNIEQFLDLSADLFEYASLAQKRGESTAIPLDMQHQIIKNAAKKQWDRISSLPRGREVARFLNTIGTFCQSITYQPNAPYGAGVTGIAISMDARDRLRNPKEWDLYPSYKPLAQLITIAISNNLLEPAFNVLQGERGEPHLVFYLNRLLCAYFDLPVQYGGWKEHSLSELVNYVDKGSISVRKKKGRITR